MKKIYFLLISIVTVFFLAGCASEPQKEALPEEEQINENETTEETTKKEEEPPDRLTVHYIDVGQADATLIELNGNEKFVILIDAGDFTGDEVVPYLKSQSIEKIDIAIATHPDADHIGQLDQVLAEFQVDEVWMSGNTSTSDTFQRVLTAIDEKSVRYEEPRMGDQYEVGPLLIEVLYPQTITGNANEESLSLRLSYGDMNFVFTGDAEKENELEMIRSGVNLGAEFLHLGHHGSSTSTSMEFLKAVSPEVAIYSAGKNNSYGHPDEEVVSLVQSSGIELYGTDVHGSIIVTTDGKSYQLETKQAGTIEAPLVPEEPNAVSDAPESSPTGCININTASKEDIEKIIHIGPERAEELIQLRPFNSVEDLSKIKGIGPSRIKDIKEEGLACI